MKLNQQLIEHNALVGAQVAVEFSRMLQGNTTSPPPSSSSSFNQSSSTDSSNSNNISSVHAKHHPSIQSESHHYNTSSSSSPPIPVSALQYNHDQSIRLMLMFIPISLLLFSYFFLARCQGGHRWFHLRHRYQGESQHCLGEYVFCFLISSIVASR